MRNQSTMDDLSKEELLAVLIIRLQRLSVVELKALLRFIHESGYGKKGEES